MKKTKLLIILILLLTFCATVLTSFAQDTQVMPISDSAVMPISQKIHHWSQTYIEQLSKNHDIGSAFEGKDLNSPISSVDFQNLVRLVVDQEYAYTKDIVTREVIVDELTKIWAEKTGKDINLIPVIKMIIYSDTEKINALYLQGVYVAYMKKIAQGNDKRIFNPKSNTTYGELATLIYNTDKAIAVELESGVNPIVKGRFETRGAYDANDEKVVFNFEFFSHHTQPKDLMFSSGQQFEVSITDENGKEVYRFSDGKFFTMALVYKTLSPGESFKYKDEWDMTDKEGNKLPSGNYTAVIRILARMESSDDKISEDELIKTVKFSVSKLK